MESLAITDHGNMCGAVDFYEAAKNRGIKPILGSEFYLSTSSRTNKATEDKKYYHIVLLAKDKKGYKNLLKLTSIAHLEGFYYKPRIDKEILAKYAGGLIALSACLKGELSQLILEGRFDDAKKEALWYKQNLEDFYLEIQRMPIPELEQVNSRLVSLGRELGIPLVATNDVHYVNKEDSATQEILLCIGTNTTIDDEKRMKMAGDYFYLKSTQEMEELFSDLPEAIKNTQVIADKCNLELDFGQLHLPKLSLPEGRSALSFLSELCRKGFADKYGANASAEASKRLEYELEVIEKTRFADYFLVVWDIISATKQKGILYGVRGSATASIVLYCLDITEIDPLRYDLVFERFLNIERKEMPDIDLDFQDDRRDELITYVNEKYGGDYVAQIITFGTLGARAALRDTGRALGMSYNDVDRVARLIPVAVDITLDAAMKAEPQLMDFYNQDAQVKQLIDSAKKLEGLTRHASTHAAGIVISREPLTDLVPLQRATKGTGPSSTMTQYSMENIAHIGLLKMDFLGLANLTILNKARELIKQTKGIEINLNHLPLDDQKTYKLLSSGETSGIFQLESTGMRRNLKELKPANFTDIAAMVALYRPGPMEHIPTFIKAKNGQEAIHYVHPVLESILKETYGVIVYQDQVLYIVRTIAGYSFGKADIFRKAMGKKKPEVMQKERQNFIAGAIKQGYSEELAVNIFELIEPFAGYAFNKAHSVSYAYIAYQTAYLKSNYSVEYMAAFFMNHVGEQEKVRTAVAECHRLGIMVFPPDINASEGNFSIESDTQGRSGIRFGLTAAKNVGSGAIEALVEARKTGGKFTSIEDLSRRADLRGMNRRALESLIKVGALDSFGSRVSLLQGVEKILSLSASQQRLKESGQMNMFDLFGQSQSIPMPSLELAQMETPLKDKLLWEKELIGVYLSEHPFARAISQVSRAVTCVLSEVDMEMSGKRVILAGVVVSARQSYTREGKPFLMGTLEDIGGSLEVTVWPEVYQKSRELWVEGNFLFVQGKLKARDESPNLVAEAVWPYKESGSDEKDLMQEEQAEGIEKGKAFSNNDVPSSAVKERGENFHSPSERGKRKSISSSLRGREIKSEGPTPAGQVPHLSGSLEEESRGRLIIRLEQSGSAEDDLELLKDIAGVLEGFPGQGKAIISLYNDGEKESFEMPRGVSYCPHLWEKLVEMVGEEGITYDKS